MDESFFGDLPITSVPAIEYVELHRGFESPEKILNTPLTAVETTIRFASPTGTQSGGKQLIGNTTKATKVASDVSTGNRLVL
jgi:hypothetical protein